jgi:NADPH:quinone reductase-like Zn-dependent oxidoreductase
MLALVAAPPSAEIREVPDPQPQRDEALVEVKAFSLNRGETVRLANMSDGELTGWDVAGVVRRAAADGSGPRERSRVVGMMFRGAWAQLANVPTGWLAELPDSVSFEDAATLPVAGITALETLDIGGNPLARRVLVTGASGGVGTFAVQLAKQAGAHVTALARRQEGLRELGADEVVDSVPEGAEYDTILDGVGGPILGAAIGAVAPFGTVVSYANTVQEPVTYPTRTLFGRAPGAKVVGFLVFRSVRDGAATLGRLVALTADGQLKPRIDRVASWRDAQPLIQDLLDYKVAGKAVLTVD